VRPLPYRPILRGLLLTGGEVRYLRNDPHRGSEASGEPLWWPPVKVMGRHLAPYLAAHLDLDARLQPASAAR
jgi:sulfide:quinone oxidoreductase